MGRHDHAAVASGTGDDVPHVPASAWVHARTRLICRRTHSVVCASECHAEQGSQCTVEIVQRRFAGHVPRNTTCGAATSAIASASLRLLPPEYVIVVW